MSTFAAGLFNKLNRLDRHVPVDTLAHVIDRQGGRGDSS